MKTKSIYKSPAGKREIMEFYDTALARWPIAHDTFHLPTRHGDTFIIASGDASAPPLVLLHGSASNAVSWIGDIAEYSRHFRVYAVDLPGEPGRSSENRPTWVGPDFAEWLEDVLDGLQIQKASLLGISQGGWTAIKFAASLPHRVEKLVLLIPGGIVPARTSFILKAVIFSLFGRWGANKINQLVLGKQPIHPEAGRFLEAIYTHFNMRVEKEYLFSDNELRCLNMPTLFIGGTQDVLFNVEAATKRMSELIPHLKQIIIPDMGHVLINLSEKTIPFLKTA